MFWLADNYIKIWKIENKGKYFVASIGTSSKQQDGTYKNSNWNCKFVGKGAVGAEELKEGDRIKVTSAAIENIWDKEKSRAWLNVIVFGWEHLEDRQETKVEYEDDSEDDSLPF